MDNENAYETVVFTNQFHEKTADMQTSKIVLEFLLQT